MIHYFLDPILKAPTIGCIAMCLVCSLVGVLIFIRKESLLGETLSHAAYPGIMLAALLTLLPSVKLPLTLCILIGAGLFSYLALKLLDLSKKRLKMSPDSALSFVLTLFFGLGITVASLLQNTYSLLYKQALVFLFGQAATITDPYMYLSISLAVLVVSVILFFYREIQITNFDPIFAQTIGIRTQRIDRLTYLLMVASIVIGIRSIGLFLLSGMFIAPAIAARQWSHKLHRMFIFSGIIGALSGFLGIYSSFELSVAFSKGGHSLSFATGPMIILTSSSITIFSLLFAPKQGWVSRFLKIVTFKFKCTQENILKSLWHFAQQTDLGVAPQKVWNYQSIPRISSLLVTLYLYLKGEILRNKSLIMLSPSGRIKAQNIVRLHRLWELYLVHIGVGKEKVHHNAEEMEHIITPHIEEKLLKLMKHPTKDPHNQPIPLKEPAL